MSKYTQTIYSNDGESSIFAEVGDDGLIGIFVSSGFADADIVLEKDLIVELAESLIKMAGEL
jgi:hypothetical protein